MREHIQRILRRMVGAFLALALILICHPAFAQDNLVHGATPVLGVNIHEWPCPKGYKKTSENQICVHVSTEVDMNTIKLAKLYGTTQFDIRSANPTRTLAFCRMSSGNWRRGLVIDIERDRPSNAVWNGCDQERQYAYVIPGETVLIERNKVSLSFGETQDLVTKLQACKPNNWNCAKPLIRKLNPGLSEAALNESLAREPKADPPPDSHPSAKSPSANLPPALSVDPPIDPPEGAIVNHHPSTWNSILTFVRGEAWIIGTHIVGILLLIAVGILLWQYRKLLLKNKGMAKRLYALLRESGQTFEQQESQLSEMQGTLDERDRTIKKLRQQNTTHEQTIRDLKETNTRNAITLRELLALFSVEVGISDEDLVGALSAAIRDHVQTFLESISALSQLVCGERNPGKRYGFKALTHVSDVLGILIGDLRAAMEQVPSAKDTLASIVGAATACILRLQRDLQTKNEEVERVSREKDRLADSLTSTIASQGTSSSNPGNGGGNRTETLIGLSAMRPQETGRNGADKTERRGRKNPLTSTQPGFQAVRSVESCDIGSKLLCCESLVQHAISLSPSPLPLEDMRQVRTFLAIRGYFIKPQFCELIRKNNHGIRFISTVEQEDPETWQLLLSYERELAVPAGAVP